MDSLAAVTRSIARTSPLQTHSKLLTLRLTQSDMFRRQLRFAQGNSATQWPSNGAVIGSSCDEQRHPELAVLRSYRQWTVGRFARR